MSKVQGCVDTIGNCTAHLHQNQRSRVQRSAGFHTIDVLVSTKAAPGQKKHLLVLTVSPTDNPSHLVFAGFFNNVDKPIQAPNNLTMVDLALMIFVL